MLGKKRKEWVEFQFEVSRNDGTTISPNQAFLLLQKFIDLAQNEGMSLEGGINSIPGSGIPQFCPGCGVALELDGETTEKGYEMVLFCPECDWEKKYFNGVEV